MKILDARRFLDDKRRYALVHTCERCVYHDRDRDRCAHGYPDATHREAAYADEASAAAGMFCKEFEVE
jgi:hypothetical protein